MALKRIAQYHPSTIYNRIAGAVTDAAAIVSIVGNGRLDETGKAIGFALAFKIFFDDACNRTTDFEDADPYLDAYLFDELVPQFEPPYSEEYAQNLVDVCTFIYAGAVEMCRARWQSRPYCSATFLFDDPDEPRQHSFLTRKLILKRLPIPTIAPKTQCALESVFHRIFSPIPIEVSFFGGKPDKDEFWLFIRAARIAPHPRPRLVAKAKALRAVRLND